MNKWIGAAAVCINNQREVFMVLQGKKEEIKTWSVPSGGIEEGETLEECCIRELNEETGYIGKLNGKYPIKTKNRIEKGISVEVKYYRVKIVGGSMHIQDPGGLIYDIRWINLLELRDLNLTFPEDRKFLEGLLE
ncbi:NUDIX hydrolase [Oceanobacillus sp. 1P07AA]|uniref:NUDIX hydrolase n=1 Tax=Oceanobacillus sp. 1P07AA TaxID=3132293 RepID=UPI0039A40CC8